MSEARESGKVQRGYSDSWSSTNVDLARSEGLALERVRFQFVKKWFYGNGGDQ